MYSLRWPILNNVRCEISFWRPPLFLTKSITTLKIFSNQNFINSTAILFLHDKQTVRSKEFPLRSISIISKKFSNQETVSRRISKWKTLHFRQTDVFHEFFASENFHLNNMFPHQMMGSYFSFIRSHTYEVMKRTNRKKIFKRNRRKQIENKKKCNCTMYMFHWRCYFTSKYNGNMFILSRKIL